MKAFITFVCTGVLTFSTGVSQAQYFERNYNALAFGGYTFSDRVDFTNGYGVLGDGVQWGVGIEGTMRHNKALAFVYQRMDTKATLYGSTTSESGRIGINYLMGSGTHYHMLTGSMGAFASVDVGAALLQAKDRPDLGSFTRFAWGLRIGLSAGDRVQGRIYGQMYSPVQGTGSGFYFGSGGTGAAISTRSSFYQFNVGVGLSYRLNE
jgi:hypothetical protein